MNESSKGVNISLLWDSQLSLVIKSSRIYLPQMASIFHIFFIHISLSGSFALLLYVTPYMGKTNEATVPPSIGQITLKADFQINTICNCLSAFNLAYLPFIHTY